MSLVHCFDACFTAPHEQFEFHDYFPLYRPPHEVCESEPEEGEYEGDSEEGEYEEEETRKAATIVIEKSEMEKKFLEASGGEERLPVTKAVIFVHEAGCSPSQQEIRELNKECPDGVDLKRLGTFMQYTQHPEDSRATLGEFFLQYDGQRTGRVRRETFVQLLKMHGGEEAMTDEEVLELLKGTGKNEDSVPFKEICAQILE